MNKPNEEVNSISISNSTLSLHATGESANKIADQGDRIIDSLTSGTIEDKKGRDN
ncbi:hypothetical protein [Lactobacillus delbrueckii]|uniref:hypothetical protein n=1 Tax=Lactobacillus delbrueckii TaxID=1584 RepID=UPI0019D254BC|nr:hypothetical protein [Lactobacillus delbrueckii]MBN6090520.1 hypothetical protein [Lactobacillus delbrueckii subsp. bulgaricus]